MAELSGIDERRRSCIAALSQKIELLPKAGAQLAEVEARLVDGSIRTAEADPRDRQIPTIDKMARKLRALMQKAWPAGAADAVVELLTGDVKRPARDLSEYLRQ